MTTLASSHALVPEHVTAAERNWAAATHLGALVLALCTSWMAGLAGMVGAGVVAAVRPLDSEFVAGQAREAFNFNLSFFLYTLVGAVVGLLLVVGTLGLGLILVIPVVLAMVLVWLVCPILAAVAAGRGEHYRYPLTLRFWR